MIIKIYIELLLGVPNINVNILNNEGNTPLKLPRIFKNNKIIK